MKKKIVFGITSLDYGGIEISLVDLVNKLVNYYDITVLTLYSGGDLIPKINRKVKIESIYKHKYLTSTNDQRRKTSLKLMLAGRTIYNAFLKNKSKLEYVFVNEILKTANYLKKDKKHLENNWNYLNEKFPNWKKNLYVKRMPGIKGLRLRITNKFIYNIRTL